LAKQETAEKHKNKAKQNKTREETALKKLVL